MDPFLAALRAMTMEDSSEDPYEEDDTFRRGAISRNVRGPPAPRFQRPRELDVLEGLGSILTPRSLLMGAAGAGIAIMAAPSVAGALGFTSDGIKPNSPAASMMSSMCGGSTAAGSPVALLQSVGATGTVLNNNTATAATAAVGAVAGVLLGMATDSKKHTT